MDEHILKRFSGNPGQRPEINVARARAIRAAGHSWRYVGIILAIETGRSQYFHAQSVAEAVRRAANHAKSSTSEDRP